MADILFETNDYSVIILNDYDDVIAGVEKPRKAYYVKNKTTSVLEHSAIMLPNALFHCRLLQLQLDEVNKNGDKITVPVIGSDDDRFQL